MTKIDIFSGFLGAGKTTLIKKLIAEAFAGEKLVLIDGEKANLTPTEFEILKLFMQNPGQVFSPKDIYNKVWKEASYGAENTVAVHIRHLREKIEINPAEPRYLKVVWGQGYKMEKENSL